MNPTCKFECPHSGFARAHGDIIAYGHEICSLHSILYQLQKFEIFFFPVIVWLQYSTSKYRYVKFYLLVTNLISMRSIVLLYLD